MDYINFRKPKSASTREKISRALRGKKKKKGMGLAKKAAIAGAGAIGLAAAARYGGAAINNVKYNQRIGMPGGTTRNLGLMGRADTARAGIANAIRGDVGGLNTAVRSVGTNSLNTAGKVRLSTSRKLHALAGNQASIVEPKSIPNSKVARRAIGSNVSRSTSQSVGYKK